MAWSPYKNGQGARRSDGLYLRRAWNWFPTGLHSVKPQPGWDLCKGLTILGTFPDQPLTSVRGKVDATLPLGAPHPLGPWKYLWVQCSKCSEFTFMEREAPEACWKCGCTSVNVQCYTPVRELELSLEQIV